MKTLKKIDGMIQEVIRLQQFFGNKVDLSHLSEQLVEEKAKVMDNSPLRKYIQENS